MLKWEKSMVYNALDISKHILEYVYNNYPDNQNDVTNLKMQKLLYYAQALYLVDYNKKPLFEDEIQAWKWGPVVPSAYEAYSEYGNKVIFLDKEKLEDKKQLDIESKEYLESFIPEFMEYLAHCLVNMSHIDSPWREAWNQGWGYGAIIPKDSMYDFYKEKENGEDEILAKIADNIDDGRNVKRLTSEKFWERALGNN
ncbi:MAG: DUF4065 domain-containing protein [Holosporales bacterium]|jgi:uncharacterized phage-associated protein|nr:DUF4065 domain-containing protein [Holosporales bacterium]